MHHRHTDIPRQQTSCSNREDYTKKKRETQDTEKLSREKSFAVKLQSAEDEEE